MLSGFHFYTKERMVFASTCLAFLLASCISTCHANLVVSISMTMISYLLCTRLFGIPHFLISVCLSLWPQVGARLMTSPPSWALCDGGVVACIYLISREDSPATPHIIPLPLVLEKAFWSIVYLISSISVFYSDYWCLQPALDYSLIQTPLPHLTCNVCVSSGQVVCLLPCVSHAYHLDQWPSLVMASRPGKAGPLPHACACLYSFQDFVLFSSPLKIAPVRMCFTFPTALFTKCRSLLRPLSAASLISRIFTGG